MKYKIKDEKIEKAIKNLFHNEKTFEFSFQRNCEEQFLDGTNFIRIQIVPEASITNTDLDIAIKKADIEEVLEYNPNAWNKYPDIQPPKEGRSYLVTVDDQESSPFVDMAHYNLCGKWDEFDNEYILAFKALPEPYTQK